MGKKKNGQARKRGVPDHFTGFKFAFLVARENAYQHALDSKTVTAFYNKVTADFIANSVRKSPSTKSLLRILWILRTSVTTTNLMTTDNQRKKQIKM